MLEPIAISILFIMGLHYAAYEDTPIGFIGKIVGEDPAKLIYPLIYCPRCMASFWGGGIYLALFFIQGRTDFINIAWQLPAHILCVYGAVYWLTNQLIEE